jgi:hypothetical protein
MSSTTEEDEMVADVDRFVRAAVTAGAQVAERAARMRAERDRNAAAAARQGAHDAETRFTADRDVARSVHRQVADPTFWEKATPERIGLAFAAATEWAPHDPQAAASVEAVKDGLREHHGLDVDRLLRNGAQHLAPDEQELASRVMGRYLEKHLTEVNLRRTVDDILDNLPADADRTAADDERERDTREPAPAPAPAVDVDVDVERDLAPASESAAHADQPEVDNGPVPSPTAVPVTEDYTVYRTGESPDATPAAEAARLDSAVNFPTSTADALRAGGRSARARVVRGPSTPERTRDLGR